ncbi:MAG: HNH endonuclease [Pseudonocardia sp.]|nr:HNH endonuclease [Pseudonocardia sp.]
MSTVTQQAWMQGRVDPARIPGCWIWLGPSHKGYAAYGRNKLAHRRSYEDSVGPIPAGLEIDHLCRQTMCVNPAHLEPVTRLENIRRRYALQTHCKHGHVFDESNTYWRPNGRRDCRACFRDRTRRYQLRLKQGAAA